MPILTSGFFELSETASIVDKLIYGGKVALLGMAIVFTVLLTIYLCVLLQSLLFTKGKKKPKPEIKKQAPAPKVETPAPQPAPLTDNGELIAVITAAIAASRTEQQLDTNFKVVSFKKR